ncbi:nitronate monooxygenase [Leptospira selangorensis]|uniref:Nitronate monooxygenase n=1 Tax=Leptospira selangorensis TaxID=2484982 RepID=A0A5F2BWM1_9LEPT|nr:nitronate monooxygenase [Leptospira selangorensis]TGM12461.1 nitronate monooxygenase [Leptospira selangorensis]TGM14494.1 nitronate monooxygenase [Leptospira selangorensis]
MILALENPILKALGLKGPLILSPLAGGPSTPELISAVSNAGGLGSLGLAYDTPEQIRESIQKTRSLTSKPIAVNLFVPAKTPELSADQINQAIEATKKYREELGVPSPKLEPPYTLDFDKQFETILSQKPEVFSFTFGLLSSDYIKECKKNRIITCGTATTLEEGILAEESGVDWLVAQGIEAGGHRGIFSATEEDSGIGLFPLVRSLVHKLKIPVIAAGGIMDGVGIAAVLALGASAAQLGTAFLLCEEAGTSKPYREALVSKNRKTKTTRVFSGRIARGLENRFMKEMETRQILPFPAQNVFTRDIRKRSAELGKSDFLSLWSGQGIELIREMKAGELVAVLFEELRTATLSQ